MCNRGGTPHGLSLIHILQKIEGLLVIRAIEPQRLHVYILERDIAEDTQVVGTDQRLSLIHICYDILRGIFSCLVSLVSLTGFFYFLFTHIF